MSSSPFYPHRGLGNRITNRHNSQGNKKKKNKTKKDSTVLKQVLKNKIYFF